MFTCYDFDGNPIDHLWQWDQNQTIFVTDEDAGENPCFHFCNKNSTEALVVIPTQITGGFSVTIPNILLQEPDIIAIYIVHEIIDGDDYIINTDDMSVISIDERKMPSTYVYDSTDEQNFIELAALNAQISALLANISSSYDTFQQSEDIRIANEQSRVNVEAARVSNENNRTNAENERVLAEQNRVSEFNQAVDLIENMTTSATSIDSTQNASATISTIDGAYNIEFNIPRGENGAGATIQVGTVTTGEPGSNVIVTNRGNTQNAIFDFTIPIANSPTVSVNKVGKVTTITITDVNGEHTATINDGVDTISIQAGQPNGIAQLDGNGKVPSTQLPSYVDDVLEYTSKTIFPITGESGIIYIDTTTNITYRWSGSSYIPIGSDLAIGETASTAYRGDLGKIAYEHSQLISGNPHGVTYTDVGAEQQGSVNTHNNANDAHSLLFTSIRNEFATSNVLCSAVVTT